MELLQVVLTSLLSAVVLFLLTKLMGDKQISQLSMFDYVTGITIGSVAAEMATELEKPFQPLVAMIVYGLLAVLITVISGKCLWVRKIVTGRPIILMDKGKLYRGNFKKARLDLSDFLTLCRVSGYFDLSQIQTAILEHNGAISFLPVETQRPATPMDLNLTPEQSQLFTTVIMDGHILSRNLQIAGQNVKWLEQQLKSQGYHSAKEVFLALLSNQNQLSIYPIIQKKRPIDLFE